jgi:hypothetical protein
MSKNLDAITSSKSTANLIALWQSEADKFNADPSNADLIAEYGEATAQGTGYSYVSDFYKYEADNGIRPRWMAEYPVEALAHEYATMYRNAEEVEAREAEGKRKEAEARKPAPAFTMAEAFSALT